jgi:hypothetical protein
VPSADRGDPTEETPRLVVVTEATWRRFHARYAQSVLLSTTAEGGEHQ